MVDVSRYIDTNAHKQSQPSQQKPACSQQSHNMLNFCEACAAICCECDLWQPITQDKKDYLFSKEKEQSSKQKKYSNDFRKVVISNSIPDALRDSHTSDAKNLAINLAMLTYGNRPNAIKFARANNSDLLRALKHLMETRLNAYANIMSMSLLTSTYKVS